MPSYFENLFILVGPVSLIIQISLCVHVYKTGRPFWWIWLIMMGSLVGCTLYVLLEILPETGRSSPQITKSSWFIPKRVFLKHAREHLDDTDTLENRLALASLLYGYGKREEAEQVVANCASGIFQDDPDVIAEVAWYKVALGKYAEAEQLISQANTRNNKQARLRIELLKARILYGHRKYDEALAAFTALQPATLGEECRYYIALCHLGLGNAAQATQVLNDIMKYFRKGGKLWRRSQKAWYKAAALKLKEIKSGKLS